MKLSEYKFPNWDYRIIEKRIPFEDFEVLLLKVDYTRTPSRDGERNIVAVDKEDNIIWVVQLPPGQVYCSYQTLELNGKMIRAISGSDLCDIDPYTGKVWEMFFIK